MVRRVFVKTSFFAEFYHYVCSVSIANSEERLLLATGQHTGEGFDNPRYEESADL